MDLRLAYCGLMTIHATGLAAVLVLGVAAAASGQEQRSTGLPPRVSWTFNVDAGIGSFSFLNSLFTNPRDEPSGDLGDNWLEGYVKPSLAGSITLGGGSVVHGAASAVGERTYGGAPALVGEDFSSFGPDDLWVGWRSGDAFPNLGDDALSLTVGRAGYQLGHGFLLYDGSGEGGSRGGYWTNARKAFEFASIARLVAAPHRVEAFYLDKDELPESESGSRLWGANYELTAGASTFGMTYMRWAADAEVEPGRDGLDVFNVRAYATPIPPHPALTIEVEYATESNGDALSSTAWSLQGAYDLSAVVWTPKISYRYAFFEGDDPDTGTNEAFDPLFLGFSDWGTWWQGEIAGEYFLSNSNLESHQVRVHAAPRENFEAGLIVYKFFAARPGSYGEGVTSDHIALEIDAYADWKLNENFTVSIVGGFANPGEAVRQASGRTANFGLGMLYLAYSF
jgi:hypothetical protein